MVAAAAGMEDCWVMAYEPVVDADITLQDGRTLAYCEWGDPHGRPLFLCHGAPGSRFFGPDPTTTAEAGVRLITADRPGYGGSSPRPGRQIVDWPADLEELAAALGIEEFDVAGHSSGGPYALASASALPGRVDRVALISCIAPYGEPSPNPPDDDDALTDLAGRDLGRAAREIADSASWLVETPERFLDLPRPEADAQLLVDPAIRSMFVATIREAFKQGADAYGWDCAVERRPWGVALDEIGAEVWIFQGGLDRAVPAPQAHALAAALPSSQLRLFPDAGHGLILGNWSEILATLYRGSPSA
jgi:pimeloyl-ACP methyl ester carboxylesterase